VLAKLILSTISSHPHRTLDDVLLEACQYDVISYTTAIASEGRNVFQLVKFMPVSKFQNVLRRAGLSLPVTFNATGEELYYKFATLSFSLVSAPNSELKIPPPFFIQTSA
jgi:hypothetical protein